MDDDFDIPSNTKDLDNALNEIHSELIKAKEDESKANKKYIKEVLENLVSELKKDEVFKAVYGQLYFQGSTYEKLRVGSLNEFDINLELRLPVDFAALKIETLETTPGFARIHLSTVTAKKGEQVQKTAKDWIDVNGYLLRNKIVQWLQGLVDTVLFKTKLEFLKGIKPAVSGPAITLKGKTTNGTKLSVDLVPCLVFDGENLPASIRKKLDELDLKNYGSLKWFIVPKGPREITRCEEYVDDVHESDGTEWRMSFYEYEWSLMNGLDGVKPTNKLLKLLRDTWHRTNVSSYYIKTMFLWEVSKTGTQFWKEKDRGYLFIYMLRVFEEHVLNDYIPFFWDERHNLVSHLDANDMQNLGNFLKRKRKKLVKALKTQDEPVKVLNKIFKYKEPYVEHGIQANQCLENFTQNVELQGLHLVRDEKEEEKQLQLQQENEGSFFNWKTLFLGLSAVAVAAAGAVALVKAVTAEETQRESFEDRARRRGEDEEQRRREV